MIFLGLPGGRLLLRDPLPGGMMGFVAFNVVEEFGVEGMAGNRGAVADDNQEPAGAGESHVHAAGVIQKTDFSSLIAANKRNDDGFLPPALETVNAADFHRTVGLEGSQETYLGDIGSENGNGFGREAAFPK